MTWLRLRRSPVAPAPGRRLRCCALGWALAGLLAGAGAAEFRLPPISGRLSGHFTPLQLAGAPELIWSLTLESRAENERAGVLLADAPGTHLRVEVQLDAAGEGTWRVTEGRVELKPWLNGQLTRGSVGVTGAGRWQGSRLSGDLTLTLQQVELGELLRFADAEHTYVRTAEGRVEGTLGLRLRDGAASAGDSALTLPPGTVGTIYFQPSPGLLTSYVPAQVRKLYPGIAAIEQGLTPLEAKVLRLTYHPDGDARGRGARLRIEGRPRDPKLVAPLELDVNFTGPLESLVRKALDSRLRVGGAK